MLALLYYFFVLYQTSSALEMCLIPQSVWLYMCPILYTVGRVGEAGRVLLNGRLDRVVAHSALRVVFELEGKKSENN